MKASKSLSDHHDQIKNLAFKVEATPQYAAPSTSGTLGMPVKIKIRVHDKKRKKSANETFIIVPDHGNTDRVVLTGAQSYQTIMSFDMLLEKRWHIPEPLSESRRTPNFLGTTFPGGCLDPPYDDILEEIVYSPSTPNNKPCRSNNSVKRPPWKPWRRKLNTTDSKIKCEIAQSDNAQATSATSNQEKQIVIESHASIPNENSKIMNVKSTSEYKEKYCVASPSNSSNVNKKIKQSYHISRIAKAILKDVVFDVEALPRDSTIKLTSFATGTPVDVKVKIKRKGKSRDLEDAYVTLSIADSFTSVTKKIPLQENNHVLLSFTMLIEKKSCPKPTPVGPPRPIRYFLGPSFPGGCLDPPYGKISDEQAQASLSLSPRSPFQPCDPKKSEMRPPWKPWRRYIKDEEQCGFSFSLTHSQPKASNKVKECDNKKYNLNKETDEKSEERNTGLANLKSICFDSASGSMKQRGSHYSIPNKNSQKASDMKTQRRTYLFPETTQYNEIKDIFNPVNKTYHSGENNVNIESTFEGDKENAISNSKSKKIVTNNFQISESKVKPTIDLETPTLTIHSDKKGREKASIEQIPLITPRIDDNIIAIEKKIHELNNRTDTEEQNKSEYIFKRSNDQLSLCDVSSLSVNHAVSMESEGLDHVEYGKSYGKADLENFQVTHGHRKKSNVSKNINHMLPDKINQPKTNDNPSKNIISLFTIMMPLQKYDSKCTNSTSSQKSSQQKIGLSNTKLFDTDTLESTKSKATLLKMDQSLDINRSTSVCPTTNLFEANILQTSEYIKSVNSLSNTSHMSYVKKSSFDESKRDVAENHNIDKYIHKASDHQEISEILSLNITNTLEKTNPGDHLLSEESDLLSKISKNFENSEPKMNNPSNCKIELPIPELPLKEHDIGKYQDHETNKSDKVIENSKKNEIISEDDNIKCQSRTESIVKVKDTSITTSNIFEELSENNENIQNHDNKAIAITNPENEPTKQTITSHPSRNVNAIVIPHNIICAMDMFPDTKVLDGPCESLGLSDINNETCNKVRIDEFKTTNNLETRSDIRTDTNPKKRSSLLWRRLSSFSQRKSINGYNEISKNSIQSSRKQFTYTKQSTEIPEILDELENINFTMNNENSILQFSSRESVKSNERRKTLSISEPSATNILEELKKLDISMLFENDTENIGTTNNIDLAERKSSGTINNSTTDRKISSHEHSKPISPIGSKKSSGIIKTSEVVQLGCSEIFKSVLDKSSDNTINQNKFYPSSSIKPGSFVASVNGSKISSTSSIIMPATTQQIDQPNVLIYEDIEKKSPMSEFKRSTLVSDASSITALAIPDTQEIPDIRIKEVSDRKNIKTIFNGSTFVSAVSSITTPATLTAQQINHPDVLLYEVGERKTKASRSIERINYMGKRRREHIPAQEKTFVDLTKSQTVLEQNDNRNLHTMDNLQLDLAFKISKTNKSMTMTNINLENAHLQDSDGDTITKIKTDNAIVDYPYIIPINAQSDALLIIKPKTKLRELDDFKWTKASDVLYFNDLGKAPLIEHDNAHQNVLLDNALPELFHNSPVLPQKVSNWQTCKKVMNEVRFSKSEPMNDRRSQSKPISRSRNQMLCFRLDEGETEALTMELKATNRTVSKILLPGGSPLEVKYSGKSVALQLDTFGKNDPIERTSSQDAQDELLNVYEKEILPLQKVIKEIKEQIDLLTLQQINLRNKVHSNKKVNRNFMGSCGSCRKKLG